MLIILVKGCSKRRGIERERERETDRERERESEREIQRDRNLGMVRYRKER